MTHLHRGSPLAIALGLAMAVSGARMANAFVERPDQPAERFTLPWMLLCSDIAVVRVERVDLDRGAVIYTRIEQLQGKEEPRQVKHLIQRDGKIDPALLHLEPGQIGVFFAWDFGTHLSVTFIEGIWYTAVVSPTDASWQRITQVRPDLNCAFLGTASQLIAAIKQLRAGEAAIARCWTKKDGSETQFVRYSMKQPLKKTPLTPEEAAKLVDPRSDRPNPAAKGIVPALIEALTDPDPSIRASVANFLGRLGADARGAQSGLEDATKDKDPRVRSAAAAALKKIGRL